MKKIAGLCALLLLSTPLATVAYEVDFGSGFPFGGIDSFVSGLRLDEAGFGRAKSGIISSTNIATSSSGGYVAPGGGVVTGDSSASAYVKTIINSGSGLPGQGGTTFKTEIRTESDGVVRTESVKKVIPSSGRIEIRIATGSVEKHIGRFSGILQEDFFASFWKRTHTFFGFF